MSSRQKTTGAGMKKGGNQNEIDPLLNDPEAWEFFEAEDGRVFYFNSKAQITQWDKPLFTKDHLKDKPWESQEDYVIELTPVFTEADEHGSEIDDVKVEIDDEKVLPNAEIDDEKFFPNDEPAPPPHIPVAEEVPPPPPLPGPSDPRPPQAPPQSSVESPPSSPTSSRPRRTSL
uniref:WW domain-containing protein n=1 Tax=Octactis speculum TaxID=3111310 RepID=A0A7S2GJ33_9STRA